MVKSFDKSGIQLRYPTNWTLETEESEAGWVATLSSPATAFMILSLHDDEDDPSRLADGALAAMRETYPELEAEAVMESIAKLPGIGYNVDFFMLDLTNTCRIRCLPVSAGCLLILAQCADLEAETNGPVLQAIQSSIAVEES